MALQFINRRGEVYYINAKGSGNKKAFSASRKPSGVPLNSLPEGYEIYERPESAQVFVRRIKPTLILPAEHQRVQDAIRKLARLDHFIVDVENTSLVVYITDAERDVSLVLMTEIASMTADQMQSAKAFMLTHARYEKMMRFKLVEKNQRRFNAERWCFVSGIEDWYFLDGDKPLADLLQVYIPHLGKESFFELM